VQKVQEGLTQGSCVSWRSSSQLAFQQTPPKLAKDEVFDVSADDIALIVTFVGNDVSGAICSTCS